MEIRNIKKEDSIDIFQWRNDNQSRKMCNDQKVITLSEHNKWFRESIKNRHRKFFIGEYKGTKLGVCRFDLSKNKSYAEVSINMNPDIRGKGYGKRFLLESIRIYLKNNKFFLTAKIKEDNLISLKLFSFVGFVITKKEKGLVHLKFQEKLKFRKVNKEDNMILYNLLKERKHNISHEYLPDFREHKKFIDNNPYLHWYLFSLHDSFIGTFYIKEDNSIGINTNHPTKAIINEILDFILNKFSPKEEIASKTPKYFFVNVSASNTDLKQIIESIGHKPIQVSYRLKKNN